MKILAIRGKNLASLESEFDVDFTSEPLGSAGIFAITGPTGAGKSTLLDALCLALFDDAPRLNKAEQLRIEDENQDNISLKDSRNILRKGTVGGYAEVDFIAPNGDKYRSCWMVRRSRGKTDGALQSTVMKLENLSTSTEEQGTKKDLLNRITKIIGLTFDQFTRAVLLAQGDFAAFLKANQNEKAELLEKLTGTEIYSRISSLIFERTGEAKKELDILKQRITDVKLLTDVELDDFNAEKAAITKEVEPLKLQLSAIEKTLNWLKQKEQIWNDIILADSNLKIVQAKMKNAVSRYKYMAMIDMSQEIRDVYISLEGRRERQTSLFSNLDKKENEQKIILEKLKKSEEDLGSAKAQLDELEQKYAALKPDIAKAKKLDVQIGSIQERVTQVRIEIDTQHSSLKTSEQNILKLQNQIINTRTAKKALEKWFEENKLYAETIPLIDLIVALINNAHTAKKQGVNTERSFQSSQNMLQTCIDQLKQQEQEAERLNNLLPTEILNLRKRLETGCPCPVCGSMYHSLDADQNQQSNINEKELESAKIKIAEAVIGTKENIENIRKNITEFQVHITNFQIQYDDAINDLKAYLSLLPDWLDWFEQGTLQKKLTEMAILWNENKIKLDSYSLLIETFLVKEEVENKIHLAIKEELKKKMEVFDEQTTILKSSTEQRALLLNGKSVDKTEDGYISL